MLLAEGKNHPLDPIILLRWQLGAIVELAIDSLPPGESPEHFMCLEQTSRIVVDDILGIPSSFDGLEGVKIFALFLFKTVENDVALFLLTAYQFLRLG